MIIIIIIIIKFKDTIEATLISRSANKLFSKLTVWISQVTDDNTGKQLFQEIESIIYAIFRTAI